LSCDRAVYLLIYSQVTGDRPQAERVTLAWRVAMYAALVMLGALLIGVWMMSFFGISIAALRIAGGLFLAAAGWEMLSNSEVSEDRKLEQAGPATGAEDVAFFPLTMPSTTGPGTISVAIALSANRPEAAGETLPYFAGASAAALLVAFTVGIC
jgi:multiple antibiotic resistance protein